MRHRKSFNHLGRKVGHRNSMLANMAASLILHKRIKTTTAKAKALRVFVEPLITKSKEDSTHSRRVVFSYLQDKDAVSELFREVSPKVINRPGGYTRILKTGTRLGDSAEMCIIELVDYNENLLQAKEDAAKSGRRRRRGGKKKTETSAPELAVAEDNEGTAGTETSVAEPVEPATKDEAAETTEEAEVEKQNAAESEAQKEEAADVKLETDEVVEAKNEIADSSSEDTPAGEEIIETRNNEVNAEEKEEPKGTDDSEEKKAE